MAGIGAPTLHRVPALDGLRAIAVSGVVLFHGGVAAAGGGFLGVDVFFVLSGYLITSLLLAERAATGRVALPRFWLRRARRLLPAVVVVVLAVVVVSLGLPESEAAAARGDALASLLYVNNLHQLLGDQSYFAAAGRPSLLRHLWSLSVEEQFYLLWPLALTAGLRVWARLRLLQAVLTAAAASAILMALLYDPSGDPSRVYYGTDTRATPLLVGAALAFLWPMRPARGRAGARAAAVLDAAALAGLAAVLAAFLATREYDTWIYRGGLALVALASALLIAAVVHPACRVGHLLGAPPLVWLGERSYGIYLWHWPVMALTRPGLDVGWSRWVLVPLQVAAAVGLATASYRWVEMPFRRGTAQAAVRSWLARRRPRQRLGVLAASALATILFGAWLATGSASDDRPAVTSTPAAATPPGGRRPAGPAAGEPPLAVGASVMLAAKDALEDRLGPGTIVDAAVGRYPAQIAARLEAYRRRRALPARVVVQMGENGPVRADDLRRVRAALRGVRRVVLVNAHVPRSWQDDVNATLAAAAAAWPQAVLADWDAAARPGLLYGDGIHPTPAGTRVYAGVVARALAVP